MSEKDFSIKICGVTTPGDALAVGRAGADAIGLNFFPGSKRYVNRAVARTIITALPDDVAKVGVFVNASPDEVLAIQRDLQLDWVQLHGDETPDIVRQLSGIPLVKAFRWSGNGAAIDRFLAECPPDHTIGRVLIDSAVPGEYGGSGTVADWPSIRDWAKSSPLRERLILAGGLSPRNVASAIGESGIGRVDTASGVESAPGRKDAVLVAEFVAAARVGISMAHPSGG